MLISVMMRTLAPLSKGSSCYPLGVLHSHADSTPRYSSSDLLVKKNKINKQKNSYATYCSSREKETLEQRLLAGSILGSSQMAAAPLHPTYLCI